MQLRKKRIQPVWRSDLLCQLKLQAHFCDQLLGPTVGRVIGETKHDLWDRSNTGLMKHLCSNWDKGVKGQVTIPGCQGADDDSMNRRIFGTENERASQDIFYNFLRCIIHAVARNRVDHVAVGKTCRNAIENLPLFCESTATLGKKSVQLALHMNSITLMQRATYSSGAIQEHIG